MKRGGKVEKGNVKMAEGSKLAEAGKRRAGWARVFDIALRSVHIGVAGVLLGAVIFGQPTDTIHYWAWWTIGTGLGLLGSELYHTWRWLYQGGGLMFMLHAFCAVVLHLWPLYAAHLLWAALLIGAVGSHMPRSLRHRSFLNGRVMD